MMEELAVRKGQIAATEENNTGNGVYKASIIPQSQIRC